MSLLLLLKTSGRTLTLALETGSFTLTGETAALVSARTLPVSVGAFSVVNESATFFVSALSDGGSFSLSGQPAFANLSELCSYGAFSLVGQNVAFIKPMSLEVGSFALSGQLAGAALSAIFYGGLCSLTGQNAALLLTGDAETGRFWLIGAPADLGKSRAMESDVGEFWLSGGPAALNVAVIEVGAGKFSWRNSALVGITTQPAGAAFDWKV